MIKFAPIKEKNYKFNKTQPITFTLENNLIVFAKDGSKFIFSVIL